MYILALVKRYNIYIYEMVIVVSICVDNIVTYSRYARHPLPYGSGDITSAAATTVTDQSTLRPPPASGDVTSASHSNVTRDNAVDSDNR
jgi:hypothetical protein